MKSAFLLVATALSSIVGVIGMPTTSLSSSFTTICLAESPSTGVFGLGQAKTQAQALNNAREECRLRGGNADCTGKSFACVEGGCVAICFGANDGFGYGFTNEHGTNNGPVAASLAKSECKDITHGCGTPSIFCSA